MMMMGKVHQWTQLCDEFNVTLPAVAITFGLLPKRVRAVAVGVKSATEVREAAESFHAALAVSLDIFRIAKERNLLAPHVPLP